MTRRHFGFSTQSAMAGAVALLLLSSTATARFITNNRGDFDAGGIIAAGGHVAEVTVEIGCTQPGATRVAVTVTQGKTVGEGLAIEACTGALQTLQVRVWARWGTFKPGPATACAEAVNREQGAPLEHSSWCRETPVTLAAG